MNVSLQVAVSTKPYTRGRIDPTMPPSPATRAVRPDDIARPTRPPDTDDTPDLHLGKNKPDDATQPRYESSKAR